MSRWKAASIHLAISALIGAIVAALLFGLWYPPPYFSVAGAGALILLLLGVDLVLGPLLTLVVFKAGKKSLPFDLAVIAALQLGALLYGLNVITQARPVFIVGVIDRFNLVSANDISREDLAKANSPRFSSLSWTGPKLVAANLPDDPAERTELLFSGTGKDLESLPQHYVDYSSQAGVLLKRARPLAQLKKSHPESTVVLDNWMAGHDTTESDIVWLPLDARHGSLTMLLSASTGEVLGALPIDPW